MRPATGPTRTESAWVMEESNRGRKKRAVGRGRASPKNQAEPIPYHQNGPGTFCYPFAIQLDSTAKDEAGLRRRAAPNFSDNSIQSGSQWYKAERPQPNFKTGALNRSATLPREKHQ